MLRTSSRTYHTLLLGLILVLTACTEGSSPPTRLRAASTAASALALTPTPYGGAAAPLGPLPASCPASPPPATIVTNRHFAQFEGPAVGFGPVWVGIGGYHRLPLAVVWDQRYAAQLHTSQGWSAKLAWLVSRAYHGEVTFAGHSLADGLPLYPEARYGLQAKSTPTGLVVDPNDSGVTQAYPDPTWSLFVGGITIPHAGCYQLDAHWKGDAWRIIFAAGTVAFA
jgi:hypothetical protein